MSSHALASVLAMKNVSSDEFRILVWLAENDAGGYVEVSFDHLVEATQIHEARVADFLMAGIQRIPGFDMLHTDSRGNAVVVRGAVDWDAHEQ